MPRMAAYDLVILPKGEDTDRLIGMIASAHSRYKAMKAMKHNEPVWIIPTGMDCPSNFMIPVRGEVFSIPNGFKVAAIKGTVSPDVLARSPNVDVYQRLDLPKGD